MNKFILSILVLILFFSKISNAQDHVGNGGHVLKCITERGGRFTYFKTYDAYEAKKLFNQEIEGVLTREILEGEFFTNKADIILEKFKRIGKERASLYQQRLKTFWQEAKFISGAKLGVISDYGVMSIPDNCELMQAIVQTNNDSVSLGYARYTINQDVWDDIRFNEDSKAILTLHELIYREFIESGKQNPHALRALIRLMVKNAMDNTARIEDLKAEYDRIQKMGPFKFYEIDDISVDKSKFGNFKYIDAKEWVLSLTDSATIKLRMNDCDWDVAIVTTKNSVGNFNVFATSVNNKTAYLLGVSMNDQVPIPAAIKNISSYCSKIKTNFYSINTSETASNLGIVGTNQIIQSFESQERAIRRLVDSREHTYDLLAQSFDIDLLSEYKLKSSCNGSTNKLTISSSVKVIEDKKTKNYKNTKLDISLKQNWTANCSVKLFKNDIEVVSQLIEGVVSRTYTKSPREINFSFKFITNPDGSLGLKYEGAD